MKTARDGNSKCPIITRNSSSSLLLWRTKWPAFAARASSKWMQNSISRSPLALRKTRACPPVLPTMLAAIARESSGAYLATAFPALGAPVRMPPYLLRPSSVSRKPAPLPLVSSCLPQPGNGKKGRVGAVSEGGWRLPLNPVPQGLQVAGKHQTVPSHVDFKMLFYSTYCEHTQKLGHL